LLIFGIAQVGVLGTRLRRQENEVATKTAFRA